MKIIRAPYITLLLHFKTTSHNIDWALYSGLRLRRRKKKKKQLSEWMHSKSHTNILLYKYSCEHRPTFRNCLSYSLCGWYCCWCCWYCSMLAWTIHFGWLTTVRNITVFAVSHMSFRRLITCQLDWITHFICDMTPEATFA